MVLPSKSSVHTSFLWRPSIRPSFRPFRTIFLLLYHRAQPAPTQHMLCSIVSNKGVEFIFSKFSGNDSFIAWLNAFHCSQGFRSSSYLHMDATESSSASYQVGRLYTVSTVVARQRRVLMMLRERALSFFARKERLATMIDSIEMNHFSYCKLFCDRE